jgi:two-component system response regulator
MNYNLIDILLVEDNMDDAELTIRELKRSHLANNLFHVRNGEEALDFIFAQNKYEKKRHNSRALKVILLDINMPKVSGIEVLEKLKSNATTKDIPVVILTSSKESIDIQKCYKLGANSYIAKPVSFDAFTHAVKNIGFYWLLVNEPVLR